MYVSNSWRSELREGKDNEHGWLVRIKSIPLSYRMCSDVTQGQSLHEGISTSNSLFPGKYGPHYIYMIIYYDCYSLVS